MRRFLPISLGVLISTLAVVILLRSFRLEGVLAVLATTDPRWLLAAVGVVAIQLVLRVYRWRALLPADPMGGAVPARRLLPVLLVGYLGNVLLPARLGEPIRAVLVHRRERIGLPEAFGSVILERILDLATLATLVLVAALLVDAPMAIVRVAAIPAAVGALIVTLLVTTGVAPVLAFVGRYPAVAKRRALSGAVSALERVALVLGGPGRRRAVTLGAGISVAAWLLEATTFWLAARSIDLELTLGSALLIAGVTVLGTALPSAPGYIGTYELAAAFAAKALGVPEAAALALALIVHVVTLVPIALGGIASLFGMHVELDSLISEARPTDPASPEQAAP